MKTSLFAGSREVLAYAFIVMSLAAPVLRAADAAPVVAKPDVNAPVTITDNGDTWTLDNGVIKIAVLKRNGNMQTILYHGVSIVSRSEYWERTPSGQVTPSVTIDPATNGGQRGEVAVKGVNAPMDIEVRYVLERGVSGFYTYAQYTHPASYPAGGFGENRFILQMNPTFNWLSVDKDRNQLMISNEDQRSGTVIHAKEQSIIAAGNYKNSVEHKYTYCGIMYRLPAYGWSSTKDHIGIYFINPTTEYIGGGAEKMDLVCHMGATLLDYWTSGHYAGGAGCSVPAGQDWKKVVGPIFVYLNALENPKDPSQAELDTLAATQGNPTVPATWHDNSLALWNDAWPRQKRSRPRGRMTGSTAWTIRTSPSVATSPARSSSTTRRRPRTKLPNLTIGLAHPDYTGTGGAFANRSGNGNLVTWQHDGNYYEFWNQGNEDGTFKITNVRPGKYTLHAFADGVLGEYAKTDITVEAGKDIDLGQTRLEARPRLASRCGKSAIPTATAASFSRATNTGAGAGICATPCCSPTTSFTPSARAIGTRTGSSRKFRTRPILVSSIPPPRIRPTRLSAGSIFPPRRARICGVNGAAAGRRPGRSNSIWITPPKAQPRCASPWAAPTAPPWPLASMARQRVPSGPSRPMRCATTRIAACGGNIPNPSTPRS